jgi:acetylglutamate kinase
MNKFKEKAETLIEMLPYIQGFRDAIMVIKFGGSAMEKKVVTDRVLRDIVLLECIGIKPVIVHGGGKAISSKLKEVGIEPHFIDGLRYTCHRTIGVVDDVLHNEVNANLVKTMSKMGGTSKALSGKDIISAKKMVPKDRITGDDIDLGWVGEVCNIDAEQILKDLESGFIPVITPLATDADGNTFNVNADIAACKVAEKIKAEKLIFLSDVPGVLRDFTDETTLISSIKINEVDGLIADQVISGGMLPKIESAISALHNGVEKVHMIDGRLQHALLLELLTDQGIGTQIIHN